MTSDWITLIVLLSLVAAPLLYGMITVWWRSRSSSGWTSYWDSAGERVWVRPPSAPKATSGGRGVTIDHVYAPPGGHVSVEITDGGGVKIRSSGKGTVVRGVVAAGGKKVSIDSEK